MSYDFNPNRKKEVEYLKRRQRCREFYERVKEGKLNNSNHELLAWIKDLKKL